MIHVVTLPDVHRRIVRGALFDPAADQRDLGVGQRGFVGRHQRLAVFRRDLLDQVAFVRLAGHDRRRAALAAGHQRFESRHDELAVGFGRLVAAVAMSLEDGTDLLVVADLGVGRFATLRRIGQNNGRQGEQNEQGGCTQQHGTDLQEHVPKTGSGYRHVNGRRFLDPVVRQRRSTISARDGVAERISNAARQAGLTYQCIRMRSQRQMGNAKFFELSSAVLQRSNGGGYRFAGVYAAACLFLRSHTQIRLLCEQPRARLGREVGRGAGNVDP